MEGQQILRLLNDPGFIIKASLGKINGVSVINKFGHSNDVDTTTDPQDIWGGAPETFAANGGKYTFSTTAAIDSISSSNSGDTQIVTVVGLDANWEEVIQTITLAGQTKVPLTTPLIRVYRMYNSGTVDIAGTVYCYEDTTLSAGVPVDKLKIRAIIDDGENQTEMAIYTVPSGCTALFMQGYVGISRSGASNVANFTYAVRPFGEVFQQKGRATCSTQGSNAWIYNYAAYPAIPEKADIKLTCEEVSASGTGVVGGFDMLLFNNAIWGL